MRKLDSVSSLIASSLWRSEPVGFSKPVGAFLNAVVRLEVTSSAQDLLRELQLIERKFGRTSDSASEYESRTIDLDLIDFDGQVVKSSSLLLPHPRAATRLFVLLPLKEITPEFQFVNRSESLDELIGSADLIEIEKI